MGARPTVKEILDGLADQILQLDPDELKGLLAETQSRMATPDDSGDWARAVVSFFIINAQTFRDHLHQRGQRPARTVDQASPRLTVVK